MSGRTILAEKLTAGLPNNWLVISSARVPDAIVKPTVVLWASRFRRDSQISMSLLTNDVELWVFVPSEKPDKIEDALDDAVLEVIQVLEASTDFAWSEADRGVLADKYDGWHFQVTCVHNVTND